MASTSFGEHFIGSKSLTSCLGGVLITENEENSNLARSKLLKSKNRFAVSCGSLLKLFES